MFVVQSNAYPMIVEIPESTERCLRLNIPEDDDAHLAFVALPSSTHDEEDGNLPKWILNYKDLEAHFFNQMLEMSKSRKKAALPQRFPQDPPEDVKASIESFIQYFEGETKSGCQVMLSNPESSTTRSIDAFWFTPLVVNHVRKATRAHENTREASPLEGFSACITNTNEDYPVHIIMDSVLTSEEFGVGDDVLSEDESFQGSHLTPLAEQLADSMAAAKSIIKEMNYMERRESRMRLTADSINARVRYFSYISVGVLLLVTYVQVTYLKRYFKKKKLL
ncbi:emp24/gp25L/p24 family protein [Nitzschia inconspicua]|uniref:Emp24/gp25L/p24 family protein n=1 Tax=Nitzschia inconspicua TaxID=303405 RepID=A0A9K3PN95_9STRA|nr:emp24/gp25L/p24 family protein [Nitzschia inconspicua]